MKFEWIPVSPDTVPDKTKEATDIYYLITILHEDNNTREILVSNWGPVDPDNLNIFKNDPLFKDYIFDDWAFGDMYSNGWLNRIYSVDRAIAWSYMPGPYMGEIVRKDDNLED